MKNFKKLFAIIATMAIVGSTVPTAVLGAASYGDELEGAYDYAYENGVTTQSSIDTANMYGSLIRSHMAKMMANYAIEVLGQTPDTDATCEFTDIANETEELQEAMITACQLGLMGQGITAFNPNGVVTRAQFGTVLSRALWEDTYNDGDPYYADHLQALKDAGIMNNISNPNALEVRGYVMLMLQRADEGVTSEICETEANVLACSLGLDICPAECENEPVVNKDGTLSVKLSNDTPDASEIPGSSSGLPVAKFTFTAEGSDITLSSVKLVRKGYSDTDTLLGVALTTETERITKAKNENSTDATVELSLNAGGYVLKAGQSVTFTVVATVNSSTLAVNDTFGFEVLSVASTAEDTDIDSDISPLMRVSSQDAPEVKFEADGSSSDVKVGQDAAEIAKFKITNNNSDQTVTLKSLTLQEIGTIDENDELENYTLYVDGNKFGSTVSSISSKYVTFSDEDGVVIGTNKNVKLVVKADIAGGVAKTIRLQLDNVLDLVADGSKFGAGVGVDGTAPILSSAVVNVDAGELTLEDVDATITKIKEDKTDVVLGKIKVTNVAGKNLELQKFGVKALLTAGTAFVDNGAGVGGVANDGIQNGTEAALTLATMFENFELYNVSNGSTYELTLAWNVYSESDMNVNLGQGVTTFELRADTKKQIGKFDTASVDLSLAAGDLTANGAFYAIETADDQMVNHITPSSLTWKKIQGSEAAGTVSLTPLANISKVRGAKDVVALQFSVEADESSDLTMDEVKVKMTKAAAANATQQEIAQVALYKGSVSSENLLDKVSGSSLAAGVATFDGFNTTIAADATQTYVVTVSIVDGADAVTNSPLRATLQTISLEDEDNDTVAGAYPAVMFERDITVTNAGTLAVTEDTNNTDNKDAKTILAGTSMNVFSIDVQATNENVDVEKVVFTVNTDLTSLANASLYLGDTLIATNTNADITATTITFKNLTSLIIPQESKELILKVNTSNIGFEKIWLTKVGVNVTDVDFMTLEGTDSGKTIANVSANDTAGVDGIWGNADDVDWTVAGKDFAIVPVKVVASLTQGLSASNSQAKLTVTIDKGSNTLDASNSNPQALITSFVFSELGNNADGYKIYKEGNAAKFGTISSAWVFAAGTIPAGDLTISTSATYVIVPVGTVDKTYSLVLGKNGVVYNVAGVANSNGLTSNAITDLELGSRTY